MNPRKSILVTFVILAFCAGGYLLLQLQRAFDEYSHWQTKEAVLEKELQDLRREAKRHRQFLDRLRRYPDFQDAIARKELGYGKSDELLYRMPEEKAEAPQQSQDP